MVGMATLRIGVSPNAGSGHAFEEAENVADRDLGPLVGLTHSRYRCAPLLAGYALPSIASSLGSVPWLVGGFRSCEFPSWQRSQVTVVVR